MKTLLLALAACLTLPTFAAPDLSRVLGFPAAGLGEKWGKPIGTDLPNKSADWLIDGWLITVKSSQGKVVWISATLDKPDAEGPADYPAAMKLFELTRDRGWSLGQIVARGALREAFLTHQEPGIFKVRTFPDDDRGLTTLVFKHTEFDYP